MEFVTISSMLMMGLGWGMLHAFDPDHLAAVAGVSAADRSSKTSYFFYALRWASGHGLAISAIAFLVFVFGVTFPAWFSEYAESSISIILITAGAFALYTLRAGVLAGSGEEDSGLAQRSAILIGLIHGCAGSAPLLALIPLVNIHNPILGMAYVLCFSAGVLLAMTCSGGVLSLSLRLSSRASGRYQRIMRYFLALFSISVGIYLLV